MFKIIKSDIDFNFYIIFKNYDEHRNEIDGTILHCYFRDWLDLKYDYIDFKFIRRYLSNNFNGKFYDSVCLYFETEEEALNATEWLEQYIVLEKLLQ